MEPPKGLREPVAKELRRTCGGRAGQCRGGEGNVSCDRETHVTAGSSEGMRLHMVCGRRDCSPGHSEIVKSWFKMIKLCQIQINRIMIF